MPVHDLSFFVLSPMHTCSYVCLSPTRLHTCSIGPYEYRYLAGVGWRSTTAICPSVRLSVCPSVRPSVSYCLQRKAVDSNYNDHQKGRSKQLIQREPIDRLQHDPQEHVLHSRLLHLVDPCIVKFRLKAVEKVFVSGARRLDGSTLECFSCLLYTSPSPRDS